MVYSIVFEKITDTSFPSGYYYAHVPALDLTTHGVGIEGAREAARDLITVWLEEKRANGEPVPIEGSSRLNSTKVNSSNFSSLDS
jgi:predicted RNase H-like HicB family nuclease